MRARLLAVVVALPAVAHAQGARLESPDGEPRIVVTITRTARVAPDRALLYFVVEGTGESPAEAAQRGGQKLQAVISAIRQAGTPVESANALPYGVSPAPNINGFPGSSAQTSYIARFVIRIQPTRVDQLTALAVAAIAAGGSSVSPPVFETSAADSVRRARYAEALTQARQDAEALAGALGGRLGAVLEVSSSAGPGSGGNSGYLSFGNRYDFSGPIQSPDVIVSASVTVRYRFLPR